MSTYLVQIKINRCLSNIRVKSVGGTSHLNAPVKVRPFNLVLKDLGTKLDICFTFRPSTKLT
jgi:hypothetical protein